MTRTTIKQTLIDHGVTEVSGALLDALTASGNDVLREALGRVLDRIDASYREYGFEWLTEDVRIFQDARNTALSTTPAMSAEDMREAEKVGCDAAIRTAESHARMRHKPSAEYTGMAVFQDGLRAYRASLTKEPSQ